MTVDESINVCFFPSFLSSPRVPERGRVYFLSRLLRFIDSPAFFLMQVAPYFLLSFFIDVRAEWLGVRLLEICGRCGCDEGRGPGRLRCIECRDSQVSQCK